MYRSVDLRVACCEIRKVEPLKRKLATLDAWVAGLRREQWKTRKNIAKVEVDRDHGGIVKLNPMADWKLDEVWDYVRTNEVPYHELFDHGYASIGCAPCTRPILPGRIRARRPLVVGGGDRQGVRAPLLRRAARARSRTASGRGEPSQSDRGGVVAMPFGYPVFLELAGRRAVVIGETAVREGKVEGLLAADVGEVTVVATRPVARLESLAALDDRVTVERRTWRAEDLDGAFVVRGVLGRSGGACRDRARSARSRRPGERDGRHPELRLGRAVDRPSRRAGARDLDRRRLARAGQEAAAPAVGDVRRGVGRDPPRAPRRARGHPAVPPRHR